MRRLVAPLLIAATVVAGTGCPAPTSVDPVNKTPPPPPQPASVASMGLTPNALTVPVGGSGALAVTLRDASGNTVSGRAVIWTADNTSVVAVQGDGAGATVRAVGPGSTVVTATSEGHSASAAVSVLGATTASIQVAPAGATLGMGETRQFAAVALDAAGTAIPGRSYSWVSSNTAVAQVDGTGLVRGLTPGSAQITASADGRSGAAAVTVVGPVSSFVAQVSNGLIEPIVVVGNGVTLGSVLPGATGRFSFTASGSFTLSWSLVRPVTTAGYPVGEQMGGVFNAVPQPQGTIQYNVNNVVGNIVYFAPVVTNQVSVPILIGVNMETPLETRCNCTIPPFSVPTRLGYYRLAPFSNVRAYAALSNYTGGFVYWNYGVQFTAITPGTGVVNLLNNLIPGGRTFAGGAGPAPTGAGIPTYAVPLATPR